MFQAVTSNRKGSDLFAGRWLQARATRLDQSTSKLGIFDIGGCGPLQPPGPPPEARGS